LNTQDKEKQITTLRFTQ